MTSSWSRSESAFLHDSVVAFIADLVEYRLGAVDRIADLWAESGHLLAPLADRLHTRTAVGLCRDEEVRNSVIGRAADHDSVAYLVADPDGPQTTLPSGLDVVLGMPPWHWAPRRVELADPSGAAVGLTEDPANVAMVQGCRQLRPDGLGIFIVGPGMLMRPGRGTLMPNLQRLGLHIDGIVELPRGAIRPDHGAAQVLLTVSSVRRTPLVGSITLGDDAFADFIRSQAIAQSATPLVG